MIPRYYDNLSQYLKKGQVLVIYGARQVGKTTLVKNFLKTTVLKYKFDSGDNMQTQHLLSSRDFDKILPYLSGYELYVLDEAQKVPFVGEALKIIVDQLPDLRVIATGSSSFELAGQIGEPLTGRKRTLNFFPVAQMELLKLQNGFELKRQLPESLIFGGYPAVVSAQSRQQKIELLEELVNSYLLKDVLELEKVKSSKLLLDLLRLLAFQVGNQVSLSELGRSLGIDYKTVARYLDLFEKAFVLFNLRGYAKNLRKEISKKSKYYFYDNGIRNAIISNFNGLELRDDIGKLWENFLAIERLKAQGYKSLYANNYFWRTWDQKEIDWVEEREGQLFGFEFKFSPGKSKAFAEFMRTYPQASVEIISKENYLGFVA